MRRDRQVTEAEERLAEEEGIAADREWLRRSLIKSRLIAGGAMAVWLLTMLAVFFLSGCATVQAPQGRVVVLNEPPGGCVAKALERANVSAITLPGFPPIVFDEREDPCRLEHEFEHKRQQRTYGAGLAGELAWGKDYTQQFLACLPRALVADHMFGAQRCYLGITWEVMALAVQDACAERLARPAPPQGGSP